MTSQTVYCPNCSALVDAENIDTKALECKCAECDHVFPLPAADVATSESADDGVEPELPRGIVEEIGSNGELYIRRSWFSASVIGLLLFCIFWIGFLVFWCMKMLEQAKNGAPNAEELPIWVPIVFGGAGLFMLYTVVAGFLNQTRMLVDQDTLYIRHRPVPWPGNRDLTTAEIKGIEVDWSSTKNGNPEGRYRVCANLSDGKRLVLLGGLYNVQAHYIGFRLAKHLGVPYKRLQLPTFEAVVSQWKRARNESRK